IDLVQLPLLIGNGGRMDGQTHLLPFDRNRAHPHSFLGGSGPGELSAGTRQSFRSTGKNHHQAYLSADWLTFSTVTWGPPTRPRAGRFARNPESRAPARRRAGR